jgi:hypothetical protein
LEILTTLLETNSLVMPTLFHYVYNTSSSVKSQAIYLLIFLALMKLIRIKKQQKKGLSQQIFVT